MQHLAFPRLQARPLRAPDPKALVHGTCQLKQSPAPTVPTGWTQLCFPTLRDETKLPRCPVALWDCVRRTCPFVFASTKKLPSAAPSCMLALQTGRALRCLPMQQEPLTTWWDRGSRSWPVGRGGQCRPQVPTLGLDAGIWKTCRPPEATQWTGRPAGHTVALGDSLPRGQSQRTGVFEGGFSRRLNCEAGC